MVNLQDHQSFNWIEEILLQNFDFNKELQIWELYLAVTAILGYIYLYFWFIILMRF